MNKIITFFTILIIMLLFITKAYGDDLTVQEQKMIQSRYYSTVDTKQVYKAAINTLQDEGFTIINLEPEVGFIRAVRDSKQKRTNKAFVAIKSSDAVLKTAIVGTGVLLGVAETQAFADIIDDSMWIKNELQHKTIIEDVNIVIVTYSAKTRVRMTLSEKVLENADGYCYMISVPRKVNWIVNENIFTDFFYKLNKSLYLEGEQLSI